MFLQLIAMKKPQQCLDEGQNLEASRREENVLRFSCLLGSSREGSSLLIATFS